MKADLKKEIASYKARYQEFSLVQVLPLQYLMIDGHGDPNTSTAYADAVASLYPLAYTLKFFSKAERDYVVMPLEGLWWSNDMESFTTARDKSQWDWTLMIMVPDWLGADQVEAARTKAAAGGPPALDRVRFEVLDEGLCMQTLHIGSYDDEAPVLEQMHHLIERQGLHLSGKHHEIYLSDVRRTAPEKLKTILRQPVAKA